MFGVSAPSGEGAHGGEATHTHGRNGGPSAARDHHVRIATFNGAKGVAHGMGTGAVESPVRPPGGCRAWPAARFKAGSRNKKKNRQYRHGACAVFPLNHVESADTGTDMHTHPLGVCGPDLQS